MGKNTKQNPYGKQCLLKHSRFMNLDSTEPNTGAIFTGIQALNHRIYTWKTISIIRKYAESQVRSCLFPAKFYLPILTAKNNKIMETLPKTQTNRNVFKHKFYLTDGGLETTLFFHRGIELNHFAAFELLNDEAGRKELTDYFLPYLDVAVKYNYPFVFETPTWRANPDWAYKLGYSADELNAINRGAIKFARALLRNHPIGTEKVLISGNIGPRGDGYRVENAMTPAEAKTYHGEQIKAFTMADADLVSAFTLNYTDEAIGIVLAAKEFNIPVVISFTVETDGKLPSGEALKEAIEKTDAATNSYPTFYMINCAHPEHFIHVFKEKGSWISRIEAIRANASIKSHAELDESDMLDTGDKYLLTTGYYELKQLLPNLRVIGGCCGTDHSHIAQICEVLYHDSPENMPGT